MTLKVIWHDSGREPRNPPNLHYPDGIDLDMSGGSDVYCRTLLPYPAKRCGHYLIKCTRCGLVTLVTTAGRRDDPRSVKIRCKGERDESGTLPAA